MKKLLALLLTVVMVLSLAACGGQKESTPAATTPEATTKAPETTAPATTPEPTVDPDTLNAADTWQYDTSKYYEDSQKIYDSILGEYYEYYEKALDTSNSVAMRYALEAIAEAKLLNAAIMLPTTTQGGNYAISRVVPRTINSTLWGNDSDRFHNALVATEFLKPADRDEIKGKWGELAGTGEFAKWVEGFLTEKGYTIKDTYTLGYTSDPQTWDGLATYRSADRKLYCER